MEQYTREQKIHNLSWFFRLLAAAVNDKDAPEPDGEVSFEYVYRFSRLHGLSNILYYSVEKLSSQPEAELKKKWLNDRNMAVHRYMVQKEEYEILTSAFRENKIDFMPIKGFPVNELYPKPEYRRMGDIDFFLKKDDMKRAGEVVISLGYEPDHVGRIHHDEYRKPPLMVLELHHEMVSKASRFHDYYNDILERSVKVGEYEYKMTDEDFYIFQLVHLNKHYTTSGTGIRSVLDMYLLNEKFLPSLDRGYLDRELEKLDLKVFFDQIKEIGEKWFKRVDVDNFSAPELYIITSGSYGNDEHMFKNRKGALTKGQFLRKRFFPEKGWMKDHFPILNRHGWLLPAVYVYRLVRGVTFHRKKIGAEISTLKK